MPYCPQCGTEYNPTDAFCGNCGEGLTDESAKTGKSVKTPGQNEIHQNTSQADSQIESEGSEAPDRPPGTVRKFVGSVAGLVILFGILLTSRQLRLWSLTGDGYYLVSGGLFIVIMVVLWAAVAWGFFRGERAKRLFGVIAGVAGLACFLAAAYFWITGSVFGSDVNAVFSALVWGFTGILVYAATVGIPRLVAALGATLN